MKVPVATQSLSDAQEAEAEHLLVEESDGDTDEDEETGGGE